MSLEIWRELEADPAQHSAFVASLQYGQWKLAYLYALISKGALNREVRSLPYRKTVESYLRAALTHPATAPEAVLLQELSQRVMALGGIFFSAALVLALFTVGLNQVGIGGIFGAVGLSAILAIVHALLGSVISALSLYGDMQQYWIWTGAISLTLAPLGIVASAILAGRRNRFSGFFAAISVATATIWAPVWLVKLLSENLRFDFVNRLLEDLISFGAIAFVVIAFASLVTSLLALVYRLPRAV
jgi:hypothetical protein